MSWSQVETAYTVLCGFLAAGFFFLGGYSVAQHDVANAVFGFIAGPCWGVIFGLRLWWWREDRRSDG